MFKRIGFIFLTLSLLFAGLPGASFAPAYAEPTGITAAETSAETAVDENRTVTISSRIDQLGQTQYHYLPFTVLDGTITMKAAAGQNDVYREVAVLSEDGDEIAQHTFDLAAGESDSYEAEVPAGTYQLSIVLLMNGEYETDQALTTAFTVSGSGLQLDEEQAPPVVIQNKFVPFQSFYNTVSLNVYAGAGNTLDAYTGWDEVKTETVSADEGQFKVTVDPTVLDEGIHPLILFGTGTANQTVLERYYHVDNTDAFTDVPRGFWGHHFVEVLYDMEIISGRWPGKFAPNDLITREEFAVLVAKALGLEEEPVDGNSPFTDLPASRWSAKYILPLYEAGLVSGVGGGKFGTEEKITREAAITIFGNMEEFQDLPLLDDEQLPFPDFGDASSWAKDKVKRIYLMGWINGDDQGMLNPGSRITRAESSVLVARYVGVESQPKQQ